MSKNKLLEKNLSEINFKNNHQYEKENLEVSGSRPPPDYI
jgi:hypothetical protein